MADCAGELYEELEVDLSRMVAKGIHWSAALQEAQSRVGREVCLSLEKEKTLVFGMKEGRGTVKCGKGPLNVLIVFLQRKGNFMGCLPHDLHAHQASSP